MENYRVGNICRVVHYPQLNDDHCFIISASDISDGIRIRNILNCYDSALRRHGIMKLGQSETKLQYYSDNWEWVDWEDRV